MLLSSTFGLERLAFIGAFKVKAATTPRIFRIFRWARLSNSFGTLSYIKGLKCLKSQARLRNQAHQTCLNDPKKREYNRATARIVGIFVDKFSENCLYISMFLTNFV